MTPPSQCRYRHTIGWSSPISWRNAATLSGVAWSPRIAYARSPGNSDETRNVRSVTASSTGTRCRSLRPKKPSTGLLEPGIGDVDDPAVELGQTLQLVLGDGIIGVLEGPEPDGLAVDQ